LGWAARFFYSVAMLDAWDEDGGYIVGMIVLWLCALFWGEGFVVYLVCIYGMYIRLRHTWYFSAHYI
jgi:hypothetical protein